VTDAAASVLAELNREQRRAVEATEGPLLVLAGAGSGKTRVLTHRIAYLVGVCGIPAESLLAVTFTNKAAGEMRERVRKLLGPAAAGVWLATFHSTCVRILRREIGHLGVSRGFAIYDQADSRALVKQALARHGIDPRIIDPRRMEWRIDQWKNAGVSPAAAADAASDYEAQRAAEVYTTYQRLLFDANALDFGDLLLRTVELFERFPEVLAHYRRRWQYVLIDEYQDTNRVQYRLVRQLADEHRNLCVVGDPDQCLPPHAQVATPAGPRAIGDLREGEAVLAASGWGATAVAQIEKVSTREHRGPLLRIGLRSGRVLECTPNHICFARLDPCPGLHYVYLMKRNDKGYRIGTTSGVRASKDRALINGMMVRTNAEVADAVWILHASRTPSEARYFEQLYSVRYGIPTMVFHVRGRRMAMDQRWIDRLFHELATEAGAERLMQDLGLDPRCPHHRPYAVVRGDFRRRWVWFTMFGDPRPRVLRPWHEHRIQLVTSDEELRRRAEPRFPVRLGKRGTWRIETSRKDYDEGLALGNAICDLDALELVKRARLTSGKAFHFMPASHLRLGMVVPVLEGGRIVEDAVETVEETAFDGLVYDLSIANLRNFVPQGVVVHNSVYGWRGADVRNILDFERDYPDTTVVRLERNYRSTQPILDGASGMIAHNVDRVEKALFTDREGGDRIGVFEAEDDRDEAQLVVRRIREGVRREGRPYRDFAVFYRTNAQSRVLEEELLQHDVPHVVVGGLRFYERAEVKDALAWLRLVVEPDDPMALRRALARPARGIGRGTLDRAQALADERGASLREGLRLLVEGGAAGRAAGPIGAFLGLLEELSAEGSAPVAAALARALDRSGYLAALEREETPEAQSRLENLRELLSAAEEFSRQLEADEDDRGEILRWLDQVALVSDLDAYDRRDDCVSLMTAHTAKGLEYPVVFVVGLEEGVFPHASSLRDESGVEEERRLFYVAMTRAMQRLTLVSARERSRFGSRSLGVPSRFLSEIPASALAAPRARAAAGTELDYSYAQEDWSAGESPEVAPGLRVRHPVFGSGSVLSVIGDGPGQKLRIRFERAGVKTIVVRFANLEFG
jgi:DNA helicase-2/ATP-dependent DNA helicase PcrA